MTKTLNALILNSGEAKSQAIQYCLENAKLDAEIVAIPDIDAAQRSIEQDQSRCTCIFVDADDQDQESAVLIKQLRTAGIFVPIIALADQGNEEKILNLIRSGASDCLIKSHLTPNRLTASIRNAMNVYQAEQLTRETQYQLRQTNLLLQQKNRELENQRRQIERQNLNLLAANRLKSDFLAVVTHEIRTPLNAIMGFSQILKSQSKGPLNDYQAEMVKRIFANGQNLLELVNDILDMSVLESNRLALAPRPFDLSHLVHETLAELQPLADKKHLPIQAAVNLKDAEVYNDARRLKQVLVNLISNAIKFTDQGRVDIEVNAVGSDDPEAGRHDLEIVVTDTGIGIAPEQLQDIFEPFYQADQTTKRHHAGTGLGLAIAQSLVAMMAGEITVESQVSQGSVFRVCIPRHIANPTSAALAAPVPPQEHNRFEVARPKQQSFH